jgi:hypothetical protein
MKLLPLTTPAATRKIEIVGDGVMSGFGVLGTNGGKTCAVPIQVGSYYDG